MPKIFITITPPPRHGNQKHVYLDDKLHIQSSLKKIKRYMIYPEFDSKGRLHYHGILLCTDSEYVSLYKECRPKLERLGFVHTEKLETFNNNLRTIIYCQKEWGTTKDILELDNPMMPPTKQQKQKVRPSIQDNDVDKFAQYGFTISI